MNKAKLQLLMNLAEELYEEKQKESGLISPLGFAWVTITEAFKAWWDYGSLMERAGNYALEEIADSIADGYWKRAQCLGGPDK